MITRKGKKKKVLNIAQCLRCKDIIVSKTTHDFVQCKCGEIFVDGGLDYYRYGAKDMKNFKRLMLTKSKSVNIGRKNENI